MNLKLLPSTKINIFILISCVMDQEKERFTPLLKTVLNALKKYNNKDLLKGVVFKETISLAVFEKDPLYLTDMTHSIMARKKPKEDETDAYPFNKFETNNYCIIKNKWLPLNAKQEYLKPASDIPHPYEPCYHFKTNYNQYLQERKTSIRRVECEVVKIKTWGLKIVNIHRSGYYAVILELFDYRYRSERFIQNVANVSSIIYEYEIQQIMQSYRLKDLRAKFKVAEDKKVPYSLFYYCKDIDLYPKIKKRLNNIISIDKNQKYLKFEKDLKHHYVNFGMMKGINLLQFPADQKDINKDTIKRMNWENIQIFYNSMKVKDNHQIDVPNQHRNELWSSDSQDYNQEDHDNTPIRQNNYSQISESQSSDSEDPLRNIYQKQFQNMSIK